VGLCHICRELNVDAVQRLFSKFPTGTAGVALLLLRASAATSLLVDGTAHWTLVTSFFSTSLFLLPATLLCIGLLTPYNFLAVIIIELGVFLLSSGQNDFHLLFSIVNCAVVGLIGPGAYSVDARIFGRRLLILLRVDRSGCWIRSSASRYPNGYLNSVRYGAIAEMGATA
jgi:hypothetical protein